MRIFAWNCHGLGQPWTVQELIRLVGIYKPNVVFLSETRQTKKVIEHVCVRLGFSRCWPIVVDGKGGGLALFWNDDVKVDLINYGQ
jgi:hypothetical protein